MNVVSLSNRRISALEARLALKISAGVFLALGCFVWIFFGFMTPVLAESSQAEQTVAELVTRRIPALKSRLELGSIEKDSGTGLDVFQVETLSNGRIGVRGSNGVSLAMGVNWVLKNLCHTQMSWCGGNMEIHPEQMGEVPGGKVRVVCPHKHVAYFNYCTLSYSAAWWDWERWEWEIDFMALNGVSMPLATVGLDAVWFEALTQFGFSELEARTFLAGPAHQAWQWMANMDGFDGPIPQSSIDSHAELGRKILEREKAFGMTPIQQGFSGHVPAAFKVKYPDAGIAQKGAWCAFPGAYQLDPLDPLFAKFGRVFLESEKRVLGLSGYFAADPFHESAPPRPGPEYLKQVGEAIQSLFDSVDSSSIWVMQSWSIRKEIATAVPLGRLLVLDLGGGSWQSTAGFWGHNFVVGQLHNFGGRISLHGNLAHVADNPFLKAKSQYPGALGMGLFMEGIEQNPVFYELVFDMVGRNAPVDLDSWLQDYTRRRYATQDSSIQNAWGILKDTVYKKGSPGLENSSMIAARPALDVKKSGPNNGFGETYPVRELERAWRLLLAACDKTKSDGYRFDVMDIGRQVLSNLAVDLHQEVQIAFINEEIAEFEKSSTRFEELLKDVDRLVETRNEFRFERWIKAARAWGKTEEERNYFDRDASSLVTLWGPIDQPEIFDYSWREWSGLIREFYLPRWQQFHRFLLSKLKAHETYSELGLKLVYGREGWRANEFYSQLADWESAWVRRPKSDWKALPQEDSVEVAAQLAEKWRGELDRIAAPEFRSKLALIGQLKRKQFEAKNGLKVLGEWTPDKIRRDWTELEFDSEGAVPGEGIYEVQFQYQKGGSGIEVEWVALLQDGREIKRDTHSGRAGNPSANNTYRLKLDALAFGAKYSFQCKIKGLSSPDSTGMVTLKKIAPDSLNNSK